MPKKPTRKAASLADRVQGMTPAIREPETKNPSGSRIMYIEDKGGNIFDSGRIGRVTFSKLGKSIYYQGKQFKSLKGSGFKANYFDVETGESFWISGPKKDGSDHLYGKVGFTEIDEDAREEYWDDIRGRPDLRESKKA